MNIFYLDSDPALAAQLHCDVHVRKMIIETAQLLGTAHWILDPKTTKQIYQKAIQQNQKILYRPSHQKHPCAVWVRENSANYYWTVNLGKELLKEFEFRFEKSHATSSVITYLSQNFPKSISISEVLTPPAQAMPEEYRDNNPIIAYRKYYLYGKYQKKEIFQKYTRRNVPRFLACSDPLSAPTPRRRSWDTGQAVSRSRPHRVTYSHSVRL